MRSASAHVDTFARDRLPPQSMWPAMPGVESLGYPARINVADVLLDEWVARGQGDRTALHFAGGRWSYRELMERSNRIANVLVEDLGVRPGQRVLLRGPNSPMMIALL